MKHVEEELIMAYMGGATSYELGPKYGVTARSIQRFLKSRGVIMRPRGNPNFQKQNSKLE